VNNNAQKVTFYSGLVWIISGIALTIYGIMGLLNMGVPGVEELVTFATSTEGSYIYLAAFVVMFIEGLYVVGSFFPGATLVIILAVLSQAGGSLVFTLTIASIFLGWCAAGIVNVLIAKAYYRGAVGVPTDFNLTIKNRPWTTWFPTFRANFEVAQVAEGAQPMKVFFSSLSLRLIASVAAALFTLLAPFLINISEVSNEEGFISVAVVAAISYVVGIVKIRKYSITKSFDQKLEYK